MTVARIKYLDSNAPNNPLAPPIVQTDYAFKRGKNPPAAVRCAWDARDGMGRDWDKDAGRHVLNEALGD